MQALTCCKTLRVSNLGAHCWHLCRVCARACGGLLEKKQEPTSPLKRGATGTRAPGPTNRFSRHEASWITAFGRFLRSPRDVTRSEGTGTPPSRSHVRERLFSDLLGRPLSLRNPRAAAPLRARGAAVGVPEGKPDGPKFERSRLLHPGRSQQPAVAGGCSHRSSVSCRSPRWESSSAIS